MAPKNYLHNADQYKARKLEGYMRERKSHNLEATSSKDLIVKPESPPQASIPCLPPEIKAARHSVAF